MNRSKVFSKEKLNVDGSFDPYLLKAPLELFLGMVNVLLVEME